MTSARLHQSTLSKASLSAQRGFSMIELLVSTAIALFIVSTGTFLLATHVSENRRLLLEARLMQDLRTAADIVSRDLRRAGYWAGAADSLQTTSSRTLAVNPYTSISGGDAASDEVDFRYSRDETENNVVDVNEQFGFRLRNSAVEIELGAGNWQALTDAQSLKITGFKVTPSVQDIPLLGFCANDCSSGNAMCPPHQQIRSLDVVITGTLANDARVLRTLHTSVRLRNDPLVGSCESQA
jgi:prepilin peptidase dependent protein B